MPNLTGSNTRVVLGSDVTLRAPGFRGSVERVPVVAEGTRDARPAPATAALSESLSQADFQTIHAFTLDITPVLGATETVRSPGGQDSVVLSLPDTPPTQGQVAVLTDRNGVVTWHFPQPDPSARGRAVIAVPVPPEPPPVADGAPAEQRSVFSHVAHKLLSVLVYPLLEELVGATAERIAQYWENRNRPPNLRTFTPTGYRQPDPAPIDAAGWTALGAGRALLFVHGTFSTSYGGFGGLPDATMTALHAQYGGRVFAYDHPTLSVTPEQNVAALQGLSLPGAPLEVDIVSHSRGGLVSRALASAGARGELPFAVRRLVYVATPNGGTVLADPNRLGSLINRYTTLLNRFPDGPWSAVTDVLSGILTAVKVIGQGAIGGLPGLQSMNPGNPDLAQLGGGLTQPLDCYGISANFEPPEGLQLFARAVDATADDIFAGVPNDIVVPTDWVCDPPAGPGFPVPSEHRLHYDAKDSVWHCKYFSQPDVTAKLEQWLVN